MSTKTIVIWDTCGEDLLKFFVVDRDLSHLNNKYFNSVDVTDEEMDEMNSIIYDDEGKMIVHLFNSFPLEVAKQGATIVVMGFIP